MRARSPIVTDLLKAGLPIVGCGLPIGYRGMSTYVTADDRDAARKMVEYLHSTGRRRIGTITGPLDTPGGVERLAGYHDVARNADDRLIVHGEYTRSAGEAGMERLLRQAPDIDAVFVASDLMAAGALTALQRAGRRVPDDVAVGGFDDSHIAGTASCDLTTMRVPWSRISGELVRLLLANIGGNATGAVVYPSELVIRGST